MELKCIPNLVFINADQSKLRGGFLRATINNNQTGSLIITELVSEIKKIAAYEILGSELWN